MASVVSRLARLESTRTPPQSQRVVRFIDDEEGANRHAADFPDDLVISRVLVSPKQTAAIQ
jgi:hypothetical protein